MNSDQLNGLVALKAVAEKKNFTQGAEALGISPSAISQAIRTLEKRMGVALLSRTTRSTSLTEAGERFLREAGPALDQLIAAVNNVGTYNNRPSGKLRINLPRVVATVIEPWVASFIHEYPDVTVELYFEDELSDLVEGSFDAGIRLTELTAKDMVAVNIFGPITFVVAGSPTYFKEKGRPKQPKDLVDHSCLIFRFGRTSLYDRWEFQTKGAETKVLVKGSLISNDGGAILNATKRGLGLSFQIEELIQEEIREGKLEIVLKSHALKEAGFYLYFPKTSQIMPKLRAFIDHIKKIKSQP